MSRWFYQLVIHKFSTTTDQKLTSVKLCFYFCSYITKNKKQCSLLYDFSLKFIFLLYSLALFRLTPPPALLSFGYLHHCSSPSHFHASSQPFLNQNFLFYLTKRDSEPHLPFQLHWSLEYWQKEIRQRSKRGSREASMFISPLTSPPLEWNCGEVRRRVSNYIVFPCDPPLPVRSVPLPGICSSILGWPRWLTALIQARS